MARALHFAGDYKSKGHLLNAPTFNGPVSFFASDFKDRHYPKSTQSNSKPESSGRIHDGLGEISESGLSGNLKWEG